MICRTRVRNDAAQRTNACNKISVGVSPTTPRIWQANCYTLSLTAAAIILKPRFTQHEHNQQPAGT